jgi:hypothetical protein
MTTSTKGITIEAAAKMIKPFVGSLAGKTATRPVLKTALVTETHIIATNSHLLIKLRHEGTDTPHLHHFKKEWTQNLDVSSYPKTDRLIPDVSNAQQMHFINVNEWIAAHEASLPAAKEHEKRIVHLKNGILSVDPAYTKTVKGKASDFSKSTGRKGWKDVPVPEFEQISFKYNLDHTNTIEHVSYNAEYMLMMLKVAKKLKLKEIEMYYYGPTRPMYFIGEEMEVIILPISIK